MRLIIFCTFWLSTIFASAQTEWSNFNFREECKGKFKIKNAVAKSLKKYPTYLAFYSVGQATTMKGSNSTATKAVYAEVSLEGLTNAAYQQMVDQLHQSLITALQSAGLYFVDEAIVKEMDYVQKRISKDKTSEKIGSTGTEAAFEGKKKITEGAMPWYGGWAVTRDVTFPPTNTFIYYSDNNVTSGMFYGNLARKENINIIIVRFYVSFANFDQSKGYKDIKLATRPQLAIRAQVELYIPKGTFATITYEKPVWGSDAWASDITKTKDNKHTAEFLGLARSAEYAIKADEAAYLKEVKAIISHWQRDIAKGLQENL